MTVAASGTLRALLREHFGFRRFRPGQERVVQSALEGRDTLVVMPTGSGKSLCFQLPALALEGTTVVVSPLIALMKDQADSLERRGIPVATVNSTLSAAATREAEERIAAGHAEFVYTTPERVAKPEFRALLKRMRIDMFVVDEAHCVSQWGHDFRPDYLALWPAIDELGRPPVLALTATATRDVVSDVLDKLHIPEAEVVHTGFERPNLFLAVERPEDDDARLAALRAELGRSEGSGIVYCATVKAVEATTERLLAAGLEVTPYHGRMKAADRARNQDRFMTGEARVMVATNAFGLGIDKPDIRFVVHVQTPGSLEAYYQEFGRAGRDGEPARCTLLYMAEDLKLQRFLRGGKRLSGEDLVNVHHALKRLEGRPATVEEILAISPVKKGKLREGLALLRRRDVVAVEDGRYRLLSPVLTSEEIERLAGASHARADGDRERVERVAAFADTRGCRWGYLLDYFEAADEGAGPCGHCDRCTGE